MNQRKESSWDKFLTVHEWLMDKILEPIFQTIMAIVWFGGFWFVILFLPIGLLLKWWGVL